MANWFRLSKSREGQHQLLRRGRDGLGSHRVMQPVRQIPSRRSLFGPGEEGEAEGDDGGVEGMERVFEAELLAGAKGPARWQKIMATNCAQVEKLLALYSAWCFLTSDANSEREKWKRI